MDEERIQHIINVVLDGEKDAFKYLIRAHQQMVLSLSLAILKYPEEAEEACQITFIRAFKALRSFKGKSAFSTWLYRIATNESLKLLKQRQKHQKIYYLDFEDSNVGTSFNDAVKQLDLDDSRSHIESIFKQLKPKEALVLKLHYLHEFSLKELAASTGFSLSNCKVLLHRARKSFQHIYLLKSNTHGK